VFVSDLLECHEPGAVRRYLLEHHYRDAWDYDDDALAEAAVAYKRWEEAAVGDREDPALAARVEAALDDDLDAPAAIAALDEAAEAGAGGTLRRLAGVLGFPLSPTEG
jgi:L-cysteine:1D-myo-inositol 2-amino-2-deoxy-alpha-D-glucopyranoside ligase